MNGLTYSKVVFGDVQFYFFWHVFNCAFHVSAAFLFSSPENALAISVLNMIAYLFCHFDRLVNVRASFSSQHL